MWACCCRSPRASSTRGFANGYHDNLTGDWQQSTGLAVTRIGKSKMTKVTVVIVQVVPGDHRT